MNNIERHFQYHQFELLALSEGLLGRILALFDVDVVGDLCVVH